MRRLILRPAAEDDLAELYGYITEHGGAERAIGYIRAYKVLTTGMLKSVEFSMAAAISKRF